MKKISFLLLALVFFCTLSSVAMAIGSNPNLNWGYTDFSDPPTQMPGFALIQNVSYYHGELKNGDGDSYPGNNKLSVLAYAPMLTYTAKQKLPCNISWGIAAQMPFAMLNTDNDLGFKASNGVLGDPLIGPFFGRQHELAKGWNFHWMFEFDTYMPLGSHDSDAQFNPGANFWTFEPFLALRLEMPYGFEISMRHHYNWNTKNHDYKLPAAFRAPGDVYEHTYQVGDMWHFNFAAYKTLDFITPLLKFGVVGYYGQQLGNDKFDGETVDDSKEKVFAIGPCAQYAYIPQGAKFPAVIFSLKSYWESNVKNRAEGNRTVFRMVMPF